MQLRPMALADIEAGLRLCRASGWNQTEADWRCFLSQSPEGCRVAECGGQVVGTVATLRFERRFSWVSMVLVAPEWRNRGIGSLLFREALGLLEDMDTVRLDATPAGKQVYDKFGFVDEYPLTRLRAAAVRPPAEPSTGVRAVADSDLPRILDFDRAAFGADRSAILQHLYRGAPEYARVVENAGGVQGFACGRHGFRADHLGPVVAADEAVARSLVSACLAPHQGRPFLLDAPRHSASWSAWLGSLGFAEERSFIRMFRGAHAHPGLPCRQFAIAGPEFG